jgi:hypothetical protein
MAEDRQRRVVSAQVERDDGPHRLQAVGVLRDKRLEVPKACGRVELWLRKFEKKIAEAARASCLLRKQCLLSQHAFG